MICVASCAEIEQNHSLSRPPERTRCRAVKYLTQTNSKPVLQTATGAKVSELQKDITVFEQIQCYLKTQPFNILILFSTLLNNLGDVALKSTFLDLQSSQPLVAKPFDRS